MSFPVPDACTLPTAAQPLRQDEFATLCGSALRDHDRVGPRHLRLTFSGGPDLPGTVRDLAARESACCSFFEFTVTEVADTVTLDIEVPTAHTAVLDGLSELASPLTSAPRV